MKLSTALFALSMVFVSSSGGGFAQSAQGAANGQTQVVFSGGYETDPRDHGRPVILIAAALGVKPEVFREAFTHVHPAGPGSGGPDEQRARQNKAALMSALGPFGVTDDLLNTVSNYYRYPPGRMNLWKVRPATAYAVVTNGKVVRYVVTDGGSGYSSPPAVSVPGVPDASAKVQLLFDRDLLKNGGIARID